MSCVPVLRDSSPEAESQIDERKRKRMLSNRESARRSRMKKQQRLDDLMKQEAQLKSQNTQISAQINVMTQQYMEVESENAALRAQVNELTERLKSMNSVLRFMEDFSGLAMDIPEITYPLLKPWKLPGRAQTIVANAEIFQV